MKTSGSAVWSGGIKDGRGAISTASGALQAAPYGFASRFEGKAGTNPEELIGAAHAGCFTMALSLILSSSALFRMPISWATRCITSSAMMSLSASSCRLSWSFPMLLVKKVKSGISTGALTVYCGCFL